MLKWYFFGFANNKQRMLQSDVFSHLKKFNTVLEVANEFVLLPNCLLEDAEKCVYVNVDEMPSTKAEASSTAKKALKMETSDGKKPSACHIQPLACRVQAKQAAKKAMPARVPDVHSDVVIKKENIKFI